MAYGDLKDFPRRMSKGLASVVYKFFDKKTSDGAVKSEIMSNQELH